MSKFRNGAKVNDIIPVESDKGEMVVSVSVTEKVDEQTEKSKHIEDELKTAFLS